MLTHLSFTTEPMAMHVNSLSQQRSNSVEYCSFCSRPCNLAKIWLGRDPNGLDLYACSPGCQTHYLRTHSKPAAPVPAAPSTNASFEQAFAQLPLAVQQQLLNQLLAQPQQVQQLQQLQLQQQFQQLLQQQFQQQQQQLQQLQSFPAPAPTHGLIPIQQVLPPNYLPVPPPQLVPLITTQGQASKKRKKSKSSKKNKKQKAQQQAQKQNGVREHSEGANQGNKVKSETASQPSSPPQTPQQREPLFVVVDTNCLIEHLSELLSLKKYEFITLVIPLVVIHELDGLKKDTGDVGFKARVGLKAVFDALQENQPLVKKWMRGQTSYEIIEEEKLVSQRNNDDSILNCTLYFNRFVAPNRTMLLTNDTALSLKAVMNNIPVKNVRGFLSTLPATTAPADLPQLPSPNDADFKLELVPARLDSTSTLWVIQNNVAGLPLDLWQKILSYVPPSTLARVARLCRTMYELVSNDSLWRTSICNTFQDTNDILIPKGKNAKQWYLQWRKQTLPL